MDLHRPLPGEGPRSRSSRSDVVWWGVSRRSRASRRAFRTWNGVGRRSRARGRLRGVPANASIPSLSTRRTVCGQWLADDTLRIMSKRRVSPGDRTLAVAYIRASTTDQHLSPDAQRATVAAWAQRAGVSIVAWHVDHGVSGGSELDDRPALAEGLAALRANGAGIFVVARRDRLARDAGIAIAIERAASAAGAIIVSADGVGNGDAPSDTFSRRIHDAAAEYERALIRLRTKAALAAKKARGERAGEVPFGCALAPDGRRLVPNPKEEEVIKAVVTLRKEGRSIRAIAAECARLGHVSRSGMPLGKTQIDRLLRRSAVVRRTEAA